MTLQERQARDTLARLSRATRIDKLVVQSMPFGKIIDNDNRTVFAIIPKQHSGNRRSDIAYGLCNCPKGLHWALGEIDRLRQETDRLRKGAA